MSTKLRPGLPYVLKPGDGWKYRYGIDFTIKAGEIAPGSTAALVEYETVKGEEPPAHTHESEDEMFYVLDGSVSFHCGGSTFDLEKGGFIYLPHGVEHSYSIRSEGLTRLLVITAPLRSGSTGGWGGFISDMESGQGELISGPKIE